MPVPGAARQDAMREAEAFCDARVPVELRDEIRLEANSRGNAITIIERRPPWHPDDTGWSSVKIAQLRYENKAGTWALYASDSSGRWFRFEGTRPSAEVRSLLAAVDADSTAIFFGRPAAVRRLDRQRGR